MTNIALCGRMQRPSKSGGLLFCKTMNLQESHDVDHFLLFLQNNDGKTFNQLMRTLCKIYAESKEQDFDYLPSASAIAAAFVNFWYATFWAKYAEDKQLFNELKVEIISFVSAALALSALSEFELGNVY